MKRRVNVRGVIINDKGELFCQRLTSDDGAGQSYWCAPGGGLDMGESLVDGLDREMIEETGVKPEIGELLFIQQYSESGEKSVHGPNEQLEFFFHITNWQDYGNVCLEETSHGTEEVAECGFIDPKNNIVLPKFLSDIDLQKLLAMPTQVYNELAK